MKLLRPQQYKTILGREMLSQIRSAFAFQDKVQLYNSEQDVHPIDCVIISFSDSDLRDVSISRYIELSSLTSTLVKKFITGSDVILDILSDKKRYRFISELINIKKNLLLMKIPDSCEVLEVRNFSRFSLHEQDWSDGLVSSVAKNIPCVFKIDDFSLGGIGISVISSEPIPAGDDVEIESDTVSDNFHFQGPYKFQRINLLLESEGHYEYSIGLVEKSLNQEEKEAVRAQRHPVDSNMQLLITATNTKISATLIDVSASGFSAKISSQSLPGVAKDLIAVEVSSGIKFRITRINKDRVLAFQLLTDTSSDQIKWLNLITPFLTNGRVQVNVADHRSLLNLFFEAGASVVDGLKYKRLRLTQQDALSIFTTQSDVLIRWVNVSDNGSILGHHSTYRLGMNSWYTGDVVGGQTDQNRVDKKFFNDNFKILKETMECFPSEQKILGSWKPNHPYWQEWRDFLINNNLPYCLQKCDSATRDQILQQSFSTRFLEHEEIVILFQELSDRQLFEIIQSLKTDFQWFLASLDIFATGNASAGTNTIYLKSGHKNFRRSVKLLHYGKNKFLSVFSQLPNGVSINPNFDSVFLFPIGDHYIEDTERDNLYLNLINEGSRLGYRVASVRFFSEKINCLGTLMEFFVVDSRGLGIFK